VGLQLRLPQAWRPEEMLCGHRPLEPIQLVVASVTCAATTQTPITATDLRPTAPASVRPGSVSATTDGYPFDGKEGGDAERTPLASVLDSRVRADRWEPIRGGGGVRRTRTAPRSRLMLESDRLDDRWSKSTCLAVPSVPSARLSSSRCCRAAGALPLTLNAARMQRSRSDHFMRDGVT